MLQVSADSGCGYVLLMCCAHRNVFTGTAGGGKAAARAVGRRGAMEVREARQVLNFTAEEQPSVEEVLTRFHKQLLQHYRKERERAGQPQLSPGTLAMEGPSISVWERMREDQIRRGETGFQRIAEQQLQAEEDTSGRSFGHPKISQGSEAILSARGESPSKRRERLARPIQRPPSADEQPTGFEGSRWHGGSAASCASSPPPAFLSVILL